MSTKFQVHGKIISDFCSVDGTKWRRIPGGIINTIFEEWNWNEDETSSMKKVDQSTISKPLPPDVPTILSIGVWSILQF